MRSTVVLVLFLASVLAGCISLGDTDLQEGPSPDPEASGFVDPIVDAHDHRDPAAHRHAWNMELRSWMPMADDDETALVHALAEWEDHLFVDAGLGLGSVDGPAGFRILDVSDPGDPQVVSHWEHPDYRGGDRSIDVTGDGNWVVLGSEAPAEEPSSAGVFLVDVSDKSDPKLVDFFPLESGGAHTVEAAIIDGDVYAFGLNWGVNVLRLEDTPQGQRLVQVGKYVAPGAGEIVAGSPAGPQERTTELVRQVYGHDMTLVHDGQAGFPVLYVAYAYQGLHILDLSEPSAPQRIAKWVPTGPGAPYYVHGVETTFIDGERVTVVGSEVFENRNVDVPSPVWILDTTDLARPDHVGTWTNPGGHGSRNLLLSAHFFELADGRVYLSHYHGGVWVLDISTPEARAAPAAVGYYMPVENNGYRPPEDCCGAFDLAGIPMTFDVTVVDGTVWAADWFTGLHGVELTT